MPICPSILNIRSPFDLESRSHGADNFWWKMSSSRVFQISAVATLLLSSLLLKILAQDVCASSSQPNPIAQQYPNAPTGTLNATLAIMPISLDTARQLIPPKYTILENAYRALLPDFPEGMYPVIMQAGLDHDIQLAAYGISIPDFQVSPYFHAHEYLWKTIC